MTHMNFRRAVFALQRHEVLAVRWLDEVEYFVDDDILQQVFRLFHELRIEAGVSGTTITATPLCFHALEKVASNLDAQPGLPLLD